MASARQANAAALLEWLNVFAGMVGEPSQEDVSDDALKKFYHLLAVQFHPDKHSREDARHSQRAEHFFKMLSGTYSAFFNNQPVSRPKPAVFAEEEEHVEHEGDRVPKDQNRTGRRVYLVTISHTECEQRKSPADFTREQFGQLMIKAFEASIPRLKVCYLAVFKEQHALATPAGSQNPHLHVAIKSDRQHLWGPIAQYLREKERVFVNFAVTGEGYCSAFRYGWWPTKHKPLLKLDREFVLISGCEVHPTPDVAAQRPSFWRGQKAEDPEVRQEGSDSSEDAGNDGDPEPKVARREPQWACAFRLIKEHALYSGDEFLSFCLKQGHERMISLCMQKRADNVVERAMYILHADARLNRSKQSRMDLLRAAGKGKCICLQQGEWKSMALSLLQFHAIPAAEFASAMIQALQVGASKGVNIFLFGPTSSAKSWILEPLSAIFSCHVTPAAKSGFPLQELPLAEVILWQDFRWSEDQMPWSTLLLLFEGTQISIRRPRTECLTDLAYTVTQPVFVSSAAKLVHPNEDEQKMMDGRFRFFEFRKTLPLSVRRKVKPCAACFASLFLSLTDPPQHAPQIMPPFDPASSSSPSDSENSPSQSSSSNRPFCGDCGLNCSSSKFCTVTGKSHL
jgi:hypothetical protein